MILRVVFPKLGFFNALLTDMLRYLAIQIQKLNEVNQVGEGNQ
jgi:hypothetical protein